MAGFVEDVLNGVPTWVIYLTVFALPFLEASVFLGFVLPGETALVFGGVLASQDRFRELQVQLRAAEEALLQADQSYKAGLGTNLERLIAQDSLLSAQLQLTSERYDQKIFYLSLLRAVGALSIRLPGEPAPATQPSTTQPTTRPITQMDSATTQSASVW